MPFRRLTPLPAPQFSRPARPGEPERELWLQLLGWRLVGGRLLLFLKYTEYLGTVTNYVATADVAWGFYQGDWRLNDFPEG